MLTSLDICHIGSKYGLYGDAPHDFYSEIKKMENFEIMESIDLMIADIIKEVREEKKACGKDYDMNCYASGHSDGQLSALRDLRAKIYDADVERTG